MTTTQATTTRAVATRTAPHTADARCIAALRMLAVDMVEAAGSGHPGLPLGAAPMAWALWSRYLRHDPADPTWPDRDRFVLSAGHGSALLYALCHLFGYGLSIEDLRAFRKLGSRTPGHPEAGLTPGVECTTGPLGQGIAHAVGLALGERLAAALWNVPGEPPIVSHHTWVLCSDGDLMEGVSAEASSLAGHLRLGRLNVLWDDNRISIDGPTALAFTEDVCARYRAYGWSVFEVDDGEDVEAIVRALGAARADEAHPSLIRVRTTIGRGAPTKAGTAAAHGAPLGPDEVAALRQELDWPYEPFVVPADVRAHLAGPIGRARAGRRAWDLRVAAWEAAHPDLARERRRRLEGELPPGVFDDLPTFEPGERLATRVASGRTLAALGRVLPELVGGAADLTESTCAATGGPVVAPGPSSGTQIHFGVREHAMLAAANGLALYGGFRPFGATFLVFSDYARPALRLAALMHLPVVVVCTHDSIGLGEDGPTHQPVEHLAALRAMPGVAVLRPADANETVEAWRTALERRQGPTVLVLSRQALPVLRPDEPGWMARRGARIVRGAAEPDVVLVATGSEVALALHAADRLTERNVATRVVSMPWRERFCALPPDERQAILPPGAPVLAIEAGVAQGWAEVTGERGAVASLDRYGASGPGQEVLAHFGFTADSIAARALAVLGERGGSAA